MKFTLIVQHPPIIFVKASFVQFILAFVSCKIASSILTLWESLVSANIAFFRIDPRDIVPHAPGVSFTLAKAGVVSESSSISGDKVAFMAKAPAVLL
jgi:hypothetical protein